MLKLIGWLGLVGVLGYGVMRMADYPGVLHVQWLGYEVETSFVVAALLTMATVFVFAVLVSMMEYLLSLPMRWRHRKAQGQHRQGLSEMTEAFAALAAADIDAAARHTRRAEQLLGDEPLLDLLGAQVAYKRGDQAETIQKLERLSQHKTTRFLATRALMGLALRAGDATQALKYAETAGKDQPKSAKAQVVRVGLLVRLGRWQEAERLIFQSRIKFLFSKQLSDRLHAITYYMKARLHQDTGRGAEESTLHLAETAHGHQVGFVPAAVMAAQLHAEAGNYRQALKIIRKCWKVSPHPLLAQVLLAMTTHEAYEKRVKHVQSVVASQPFHRESALLQARLAIAHECWDEARLHVKTAMGAGENADVYAVLAEIEQKQHPYQHQQIAADLMRKAALAPVSERWVCQQCGHVAQEWEAHCPACDGFDVIVWAVPQSAISSEKSLHLLG